MRHDQRHYESADRWCGTHPTESDGSTVQDLIGKHRQQRRRTSQQHREQVQRDRCQDHLLAEYKSHSGDQTFPSAFLDLISRLCASTDWQNENKKGKRAECIQYVDERETDVGDQQAANPRSDNRSDLEHTVVPGDRVRKRVARDQRREKRAARRPTKCARRASDKKKEINQRNRSVIEMECRVMPLENRGDGGQRTIASAQYDDWRNGKVLPRDEGKRRRCQRAKNLRDQDDAFSTESICQMTGG